MQLPELPLKEWEQSKMTLHLYAQIIGKIRLKVMPRKNHWWNITLYVNTKGITTGPMFYNDKTFEILLDLLEHKLEVFTSEGNSQHFSIEQGVSVADFYNKLFSILNSININLQIIDRPYSLPDAEPITTPFSRLTQQSTYQKEYVERFWQILLWVNSVFTEFSGRFYGKTCPVHIYWHHMDIAVTRFSGKKIPLREGMRLADKDAYSHEVISFGFWAGDDNVQGPAFYSYTYPAPSALDDQPLKPSVAKWQDSNGSPMALLMYDDLRKEAKPREALLDFLETSYKAGATLAGWDIDEMEVPALASL